MALSDIIALVFVQNPVATYVTKSRANVLVKPVFGGHTVMKHVLCFAKTNCATLLQETASIVFLEIMDWVAKVNALRVVKTHVTLHQGYVSVNMGFIQPIAHYNVQKTAITVPVYKKVDFVHHVYQENMATFVRKIVLVIVMVIVSKLQAFVGIVQKENTVFIVTKRVTKIVKVISVTGLLEDAITVK